MRLDRTTDRKRKQAGHWMRSRKHEQKTSYLPIDKAVGVCLPTGPLRLLNGHCLEALCTHTEPLKAKTAVQVHKRAR